MRYLHISQLNLNTEQEDGIVEYSEQEVREQLDFHIAWALDHSGDVMYIDAILHSLRTMFNVPERIEWIDQWMNATPAARDILDTYHQIERMRQGGNLLC